jgi:hypothetical protein
MDDQHDPASHPSPIDINALDDKLDDLQILLLQLNQKPQCHGIQVDFSPGNSAHLSYSFGIHDEFGDPWDYSVTKGIMI